jgi:multiple sugar transport system substrate-binding protein
MTSSKFRTYCLLLLSTVYILLSLFACTPTDKTETPGDNQITLAHDKGIVAEFQTFFEKQGEECDQSIGIKIKPIATKTSEVYIDQMKAVLPTLNAPELFTWWSTYRVRELVESGLVMDITSLWNRHKDEYPEGLREAFTIENKVYGFPYTVEYWAVWYNKSIFKDLQIEEPETWDDFIQICEKLKTNNIAPVLSSLQGTWPGFIWFEEMMIGEDPDLYVDLCEGRIKYTHPRVRKVFEQWAELIKSGYFTDPTERMFTNVGHLWKTKKIGMVLCGSWYYSSALISQGVSSDDIGVFILPSHNPSAGNNIIVEAMPVFLAQNSKNSKAALKVADWWLSPEGNGHFAEHALSFSGNSKADVSYLPLIKKKLLKQINTGETRILNRYWEATPAPIGDYAVKKFAEFILDPNEIDSILIEIEKVAEAYWKTQRP